MCHRECVAWFGDVCVVKLVGREGFTIYKSGYAVHGRGYVLREQAVALKVSGMRGGRCGASQRVSSVVCLDLLFDTERVSHLRRLHSSLVLDRLGFEADLFSESNRFRLQCMVCESGCGH